MNECIITSGKLILDMYYSLKRKKISLPELHFLLDEVEVACYQMERLYAYKCWFRNSYNVNDRVIKMHMTLHFVYEIIETGSTENTNVLIYENLHIVVAKEPFKAGLKRIRFMLKELYERIERKRLLRIICARYRELRSTSVRLDMTNSNISREPWIVYHTRRPNVVKYKFSLRSGDSEELYYNATMKTVQTLSGSNPVNKNPIVPLDYMFYELKLCQSASTFLRRFMRRDKGR